MPAVSSLLFSRADGDNGTLSLLPTPSNGRIHGWVSTPNVRGTWDILTSCLATTFLCTYTLLCLNVPGKEDSSPSLILRHLKWMALAILAPEVVLTYAAGQWSRARQSVEAFKGLGHLNWTMRMAFFADMGGFFTKTPDGLEFPLNAKQLHWLVENGCIDFPEVTDMEIWDKSKQDRLTKVITACQIAYFVLLCIGRAAQNLPLTTLELNTLAIVVCSLMTAFAWMHKPANVRTPIYLVCNKPDRLQRDRNGCKFTPLDFVDANMPGWSMNVQPFLRLPTIPTDQPLRRIPNDRFPTNPYGLQEYFLCLATLLFTGIHVAGWNFSFPSTVEQLLWRICSLSLFLVTVLFWFFETAASWYRLGRWHKILVSAGLAKKRRSHDHTRKDRDPATLPLPWEFWSIAPVAVMYGIARLYLLTEAFIELRNLESYVFLAVDWSRYLPHVQSGS